MSYYSPPAKLQNPGAGMTVGYAPGPWTSRQNHAVVTDNYSVGGGYALRIRNWDTVEVRGNVAGGAPDVAYLEDASLANYTWSANTYYADPGSPAWYFNARVTWQQWKDATGLGGSDAVTAQPAAPKVFVRLGARSRSVAAPAPHVTGHFMSIARDAPLVGAHRSR